MTHPSHPDDSANQNGASRSEKAVLDQLDQMLPVDDLEEEISENGIKVRKKGIYILPNLFTTASLFSGFFAIVSSVDGNYENAAIAIFIAMVLDMLDGRIARLTNTQSKFGAEYDSLADMVSFGIAPAVSIFIWSLQALGKLGWAITFIYIAAAALRLARFNTQTETADKNYFTGLASPSAAAMLAGSMWVFNEHYGSVQYMSSGLLWLIGFVTLVSALLMVSNVRYHSFKSLNLKERVPFVVILLAVIVFAVVMIETSVALLTIFGLYVLSGPVFTLWSFKEKK
ncbi:MAG: CDP-diacylglycerol--serine O-phosphatidyltransferase [Cellvibrionales bacterium]|nr:CDP-diacylglycerol--serine O-phosphatidyltransferase [Cellvibrionales bacterium]